jgi:hypothetical protein
VCAILEKLLLALSFKMSYMLLDLERPKGKKLHIVLKLSLLDCVICYYGLQFVLCES